MHEAPENGAPVYYPPSTNHYPLYRYSRLSNLILSPDLRLTGWGNRSPLEKRGQVQGSLPVSLSAVLRVELEQCHLPASPEAGSLPCVAFSRPSVLACLPSLLDIRWSSAPTA